MDFFNELSVRWNIKLNSQQRQAVLHQNGPALVLAGPGSGKTTVIISRLVYLISKLDVSPGSILTMTFNKAAADQMRERFQRITNKNHGDMVPFRTLHSFCNSIIAVYEKMHQRQLICIEESKDPRTNKYNILREIYQKVNHTSATEEELENLISEIGFIKNKMIQDFEVYKFNTKNLSSIYVEYEQYKKIHALMDFDDMLKYAYHILRKYPHLLNHYRSRYKYIQIDEGQDLSKIQWEIIKLLADSQSNLFMVADDDQSIYGFRGAEPQNILNIQEYYPNCKKYYLEHNYRSSKNIVEISSKFIKVNRKRFDKNHSAEKGMKNDPFIIEPPDEQGQLNFLLDFAVEAKERYEGKNVAILYRTNLSSIPIVEILERKGISFNLKEGKVLFFKHWVVQDMQAFMELALDQTNKNAFEKICFRMKRFFSKKMLECVIKSESQKSVIDVITHMDELEIYQKLKIADVKRELNQLAKMEPSKALIYIEAGFGYAEWLKQQCDWRGLDFGSLYALIGILKDIAVSYKSIPTFLSRLKELEHIFDGTIKRAYGSNITLSTIHASKGLEYDYVLMVDLINEEFPGDLSSEQIQSKENMEILEEERRLFYVGMTRAKEKLYLVAPRTRYKVKVERSVFIDEVKACMCSKVLDGICEGMVVQHKHFGEGIILKIDERSRRKVLKVSFSGIIRDLDLELCLEKRILVV